MTPKFFETPKIAQEKFDLPENTMLSVEGNVDGFHAILVHGADLDSTESFFFVIWSPVSGLSPMKDEKPVILAARSDHTGPGGMFDLFAAMTKANARSEDLFAAGFNFRNLVKI